MAMAVPHAVLNHLRGRLVQFEVHKTIGLLHNRVVGTRGCSAFASIPAESGGSPFARDTSTSIASSSGQGMGLGAAASPGLVEAPRLAGQRSMAKRRLDELCVERYPAFSRSLLQSWILQGKVFVDGQKVAKPGTQVRPASNIDIHAEVPKYVCRAGFKLEAALEHFGISPAGLVALDAGLSTGGFTDCLLQRGARRVYGVDVGYGQVHEKVRRDERVVVMERTNLRHLFTLPEAVDLVTLDLAFISVTQVMPAVCALLRADGEGQLVVLIKPQFEAGRSQVGAGGIVRDPMVHQQVISKVTDHITSLGFEAMGFIESPIKGAMGNVEFLAYFQRRQVDTSNSP